MITDVERLDQVYVQLAKDSAELESLLDKLNETCWYATDDDILDIHDLGNDAIM